MNDTEWLMRQVYAGIKIMPMPTEADVADYLARMRRGWPEITDSLASAASQIGSIEAGRIGETWNGGRQDDRDDNRAISQGSRAQSSGHALAVRAPVFAFDSPNLVGRFCTVFAAWINCEHTLDALNILSVVTVPAQVPTKTCATFKRTDDDSTF